MIYFHHQHLKCLQLLTTHLVVRPFIGISQLSHHANPQYRPHACPMTTRFSEPRRATGYFHMKTPRSDATDVFESQTPFGIRTRLLCELAPQTGMSARYQIVLSVCWPPIPRNDHNPRTTFLLCTLPEFAPSLQVPQLLPACKRHLRVAFLVFSQELCSTRGGNCGPNCCDTIGGLARVQSGQFR